MRIFLGIILGILLTVGAAYISDSVRNTSGGEGTFDRPVVNWDVLNHGIKTFSTMLQEGWVRLTGHPKDN
ncbi:MAG TPA: hypothetical protein VL996_11285 [Methylocella sp.]|nr:hypothetical protein [Methylocella sp.]